MSWPYQASAHYNLDDTRSRSAGFLSLATYNLREQVLNILILLLLRIRHDVDIGMTLHHIHDPSISIGWYCSKIGVLMNSSWLRRAACLSSGVSPSDPAAVMLRPLVPGHDFAILRQHQINLEYPGAFLVNDHGFIGVRVGLFPDASHGMSNQAIGRECVLPLPTQMSQKQYHNGGK